MNFGERLRTMADAACAGDGQGVRDCFTEQGVYHDVFYGAFQGQAIVDMIENYFHRDARDFLWELDDPVSDGRVAYARYVFSFESKLPEAAGRRTLMEGVSICLLEGDLITSYREVAVTTPGLLRLGFSPERCAKIAAREGRELAARPESAAHGVHG